MKASAMANVQFFYLCEHCNTVEKFVVQHRYISVSECLKFLGNFSIQKYYFTYTARNILPFTGMILQVWKGHAIRTSFSQLSPPAN